MENLNKCIEACLICVITCESNVTASVSTDHKECILLCRDCADICTLCARFQARESIFAQQLHALCAKICRACAAECDKHAEHSTSCKACAEACKKCADMCEHFAKA